MVNFKLIDDIISYEKECDELDSLLNEYAQLLNISDEYSKCFSLSYLVDNRIYDNLMQSNIKKLIALIPDFYSCFNKITDVIDNVYYDGKDVGCYLKYDEKIFKVNKRNVYTVYDSCGEKYHLEYCIIPSKKEVRQFKINKIL